MTTEEVSGIDENEELPKVDDAKIEDQLATDEKAKEEAALSEFEEHMSMRNYMRDLVLGANDGLVSIFALVLGVAGGGLLPRIILLTGISGAVAGAISMAIGEYISTKSQEQVYDAEQKLERVHLKHFRDHEKQELYEFYEAKGFSGEMLETIVETIASDDEIFLREMMMAEFGVLEEERRSPITATLVVGLAFFVGSLPPIIPFIFATTTLNGLILASILSAIGLFTVGGLKSWITKSSVLSGGGENMLLGALGAAITYLIGFMVGTGV